jgi:hypothetical protein
VGLEAIAETQTGGATDTELALGHRESAGFLISPVQSNRRHMSAALREQLEDAAQHAARRVIEALDDPDTDVRLRAANSILDRLYGKPSVAITGQDGAPLIDVAAVVEAITRLAEATEVL